MEKHDVIVIGAGVVGCAVARELSRYRLNVAVIEKHPDVAMGNSSRNSGVLHAGFTYKPGTLRAICAVEGNEEFDKIAEELSVPFKRTGKLIVGFDEHDRKNLLKYKSIGEQNGVKGLEIVDKKRMHEIDPNAGGEFAMYSPMSGILDPIKYTIALAENACKNGVKFFFEQEVTGITKKTGGHIVRVKAQGKAIEYETRWVINCAGMFSDQISEMLGFPKYPIRGFKGEYFVLDKNAGKNLRMPVYPAPTDSGAFATHATPTIDGNVIIGPDSHLVEDKEDYSVEKEHLDELIRDGSKMFDNLKKEYFIRNFAGLRAKRYNPETGENMDFLIECDQAHPYAVNIVGIESPGLTSALPIARRAVSCIAQMEKLEKNERFDPIRKVTKSFSEMDLEEQKKRIEENPDYGEIICRCENVSKADIIQAIHNPLGVHTVEAIKNRTRATMGRCQGGYCETRIVQLLGSELDLKPEEIRLSTKDAYMFTGTLR